MTPVLAAWFPAHAWVTDLSQMAAGSLIAAIWQGILLTGGAALALRLFPKIPAGIRFAIWFGIFVVVAALPIVAFWPRQAAAGEIPGSGHAAWLVIDERWCIALAAIWAFASAIRAVTLISAAFRVRALWKRAVPIDFVDSTKLLGQRRASVCVSDEVDRPTVVGFFAPKILIPVWLLEKLTPVELEHVVLHEASHLNRADDWMNLIQKVALVLFPLNPVLAWVERRLCFERELACDERVLRVTRTPKAYAECLASLAGHRLERRGFGAGLALALGLLGRESELGRRVRRILKRGELMKPTHARFVLGGAMVLLFAAATGLERCPQIVKFSVPESLPMEQATIAALPQRGYHPVSLKFSATPASQWKSIGDAEPVIAKPVRKPARPVAARPGHALATPQPPAEPAAIAAVARPRRTLSAKAIQTVAPVRHTDRTPMIIVTRWVTIDSSAPDGTRMVRTMQEVSSQPVDSSGSVHFDNAGPAPYAAVPVQGGWLIFQL